ncbi:S1 family peptidase [Bdellovibrio sp. HCB2-146]|uniref:S1 family peptidase n=1 Tax=Bdellovibrio sp. HCB2-146 TaxID=3394362 RepID=UPI0039BCFCE9
MKFALLLISLFILSSCGEYDPTTYPWSLANDGIIGGKELFPQDEVSPYVVMTYNPDGNKICTGTLIRENVILTAAHCLSEKPDGLKIIFGVAPMTSKYVSRKSVSFIPHPSFRAPHAHDIALIIFAGGLPPGFKPVEIAPEKFPLKEGYKFTAVGYGRTLGRTPSSPQDKQGMARLRSTHLAVTALSDDGRYFLIKQSSDAGVCSGDSGGPALMRYRNVNYIVGVLSAVVWSGQIKDGDTCADRARYMRVSGYADWINKSLKNLVQ